MGRVQIALPNGGTMQEVRHLEFPLLDPGNPSATASMQLPSKELAPGPVQIQVLEALQKIIQFLDAAAIMQWNCYTELIMARGDRQEMQAQMARIQQMQQAQQAGQIHPAAPIPGTPPPPPTEAEIVANLQARPVAPMQPNRAQRRHPNG